MPTTLNSIMARSPAPTSGAAAERARARRTEKRTRRPGPPRSCGGGGDEERDEAGGRRWYVYGLCTYFVQVFLLPVLFPLMVAQRASPASGMPPPRPSPSPAVACHRNGTLLYQMVVHRSIHVTDSRLSPLHWTAISWFAGIIITAPVLPRVAQQLDHGYHQPFILGAATAIGSFICLLTGFFKTTWLFPFYIAIVTMTITCASAVHTRHLGLIVRGLSGDQRVQQRRKPLISSSMSLFATSFGSFGTAFIALFTFHMLRRTDHLTSLWVVSIFCGLKWFLGFTETFFANRPGSPSASLTLVSNYWPQLVGRLIGVFLSSVSSTCIFTSATLYLVGGLCMKPVLVLAIWMVYFVFAAVALPTLHPIQLLLRADPVKMNLLGFILSATASGFGFYFKDHRKWHFASVLLIAIVQSAGAGILNAFGRVMVLDRAPTGKEGVFSSWYEWVKMSGACAGFALAAVYPDNIRKTFGVSFLAVFVGIVVLIFGSEVRDFGGKRLQHEKESESSDNGMEKKGDQSKEYIGEREGKLGEASVQV
ncbi:uncharacterized protein A4U43_C01F9280 [Asparagus officinalis]|uniref:Major facilitator superfamily (MFS) profile domain-containing protein n=1 Tax=Asparagus officinalis TaxID=4686 RepID=A0A5P1FPS1_ASPOF|nr:uncharacterized protein LOC109819997 [Asparagus officinalis]ONK79713.1 uncharacterized protein A4U43_C01F9280 [Asparagus officinalis]